MIEGDEYALGARDPFGAVKEAAVLCGKRKNQSRKERTKLHQNGVCTAASVPRAEQKYRIEHLGIGGHTNGPEGSIQGAIPSFHSLAASMDICGNPLPGTKMISALSGLSSTKMKSLI